MLPDRVSNPGPLTYESGALPIALRGPAVNCGTAPTSNQIVESHGFILTSPGLMLLLECKLHYVPMVYYRHFQ